MRLKVFSLVLALALALAAAGGAWAEELWYGTMMVDNCEEWVSLREAPDTGARRLAKVPLFAIVTDAQWSPDCGDFIYCDYDGQMGYILAKYLVGWADPEPETEARYYSPLGFSFAYSEAIMEVEEGMSEDGQSLMIAATVTDLPVYLEIMTAESVGMLPWKFLETNAPANTEYIQDSAEGGDMHWFIRTAEYNDGILEAYYAVDGAEDALVAVGTWPGVADFDWSEEFTQIMRSIRFESAPPVRADWTGGTDDALVVDEHGLYVALEANENLTGVKLLALELVDCDEDGNVEYDAETLYERDSLSPEAPLVVKLAFPGDMPSYGLSFVDASGEARRFAIGLSGRDGSLEMSEY